MEGFTRNGCRSNLAYICHEVLTSALSADASSPLGIEVLLSNSQIAASTLLVSARLSMWICSSRSCSVHSIQQGRSQRLVGVSERITSTSATLKRVLWRSFSDSAAPRERNFLGRISDRPSEKIILRPYMGSQPPPTIIPALFQQSDCRI